MERNEFSNIGEEIRDAVEDAISSMDFAQLNKTISDTVTDAVEEVRRQFIGRPSQTYTRREENHEDYHRRHRHAGRDDMHTRSAYRGMADTPPGENHRSVKNTPARPVPSLMKKLHIHPPSRTAGILLTVFGSIGLGVSVLALLALLISALFTFTANSVIWLLGGLLLTIAGISALLLGRGNMMRAKLSRLKLYLLEANEKTYCSIRDLVGRTGKQEKYIIKDLKKMIKSGILPHAHLDDKNTCLMLDDETYRQYLLSMESLKQRTAKEQSAPSVESDDPSCRMNQVTAEGREYLNALREANQAIPGEVISAKLDRLDAIIEKIFNVVDKHPEQVDDLERFMEYYLPTTIKLVNAYRDFDSVGFSGDNISMAKADVEKTLDTINAAFEQLLDSLYQDEAFDISTDASVLQTMLKKDGYTGSDFDRRDES